MFFSFGFLKKRFLVKIDYQRLEEKLEDDKQQKNKQEDNYLQLPSFLVASFKVLLVLFVIFFYYLIYLD